MMDIEKTKQFYQKKMPDTICQCAYCKNYVQRIKSTYPNVAAFLDAMGVDIEKPLETMPLDPENGYLDYIVGQYVVMGTEEDFQEKEIGNVRVAIENNHPGTGVAEAHFVISIFPIRLKWLD